MFARTRTQRESKRLRRFVKFLFSFFFFITLLFTVHSSVYAATYYVDDTSGLDTNSGTSTDAPWKTINKVNTSSFSPGDSVLFKKGEIWREQLTVPSSGTAGNPITFGSYGSGNKPIINGNNTTNGIIIQAKSYIQIQNFEITSALDFGISIASSSDVTISDFDVHGSGNDNILIGGYNITVKNGLSYNPYQRVAGPTITGLEIADNAHDVLVDNVEIYGSPDTGLSIHAHAGGTLPYNVVIKNVNSHDNNLGFQVYLIDTATMAESPSIIFDNCRSTANTTSAFYMTKSGTATSYPSKVTIKNCFFKRSVAGYVMTIRGDNHTMQYNRIVGNSNGLIWSGQNLKFYNNTIYVASGSSYIPIMVENGDVSGADIRNNIFYTGSTNNFLLRISTGTPGTITINYNLYYINLNLNVFNRFTWFGTNYTWPAWKSNNGQDGNSLAPVDPLFTNIAGDDFTLQSGSPAINAGVNLGLTSDYLGTCIPQGSAPDIGAYEFPGTNSCSSASTASGGGSPSANCPSGFNRCISSGPSLVGNAEFIKGDDSDLGVQAYISKTTHHDDVYLTIQKQTINSLLTKSITFPWARGLNIVSDIYYFNAVSAFNGYPILEFDKPATVMLKYNPAKLNGRLPNQLRIAWYDTNSKKWEVLENNTVVNPKTNIIANSTRNFSYFAVVYPTNTYVLGQNTRQESSTPTLTATPQPTPTPIPQSVSPNQPHKPKHCFWFICW